MEEKWADVVGYESRYRVSNYGRVMSMNYRGRTGKKNLVKPFPNEKGYLMVIVWKDKKRKTVKVHKLVAEAFVANPNGYAEVNHIDGNKTNNRADNLEWTTRKANMQHAEKTGLMKHVHQSAKKAWCIPVIAKNVITGEESAFNSITEASAALGAHDTKISACLNGSRKTTGGYTFRKAVVD